MVSGKKGNDLTCHEVARNKGPYNNTVFRAGVVSARSGKIWFVLNAETSVTSHFIS